MPNYCSCNYPTCVYIVKVLSKGNVSRNVLHVCVRKNFLMNIVSVRLALLFILINDH